jgi:hypothetical protein
MIQTLKSRTGKLNHATVSDIHLNHPRIPTIWILRSLDYAFPDTDATGELDYIWFAGDLFDRIAQLPQNEVSLIHGYFRRFLTMCHRRNIRLRFLEGTPSHDRKQVQLIVDINASLGDQKADLRYIDKLCIDYESEFDFHVLYVPDEWHHDPAETWQDVLEQLRLHGLDKVDVSVMHGYMDFQTGGNKHITGVHCSKDYSAITRWFCTIGHVHTMSYFRNIFAQGSLDRLAQGEEQPKGHFRFSVNMDDDAFTYDFIKNPKAMPCFRIDVLGFDFDQALTHVEKQLSTVKFDLEFPVKKHAYINVVLTQEQFAAGLLSILQDKYPYISWKKENPELKEKTKTVTKAYTLATIIPINPNNYKDLVKQELIERNVDMDDLDDYMAILEEL